RLVLALGRVARAAVPPVLEEKIPRAQWRLHVSAPSGSRSVRRNPSHCKAIGSIASMRGVVILPAVLAAALAAAVATPARVAQVQHVTMIGDSVADAIPNDSPAVAILRQGIELDLEGAPCRRVEGEGCPYQGARPPSA